MKDYRRERALENCIRRLRDALEFYADPELGWESTEHADAFEESRELVPDAAMLLWRKRHKAQGT